MGKTVTQAQEPVSYTHLINKATKLLTYLVGQDKTYDATIRLGIETLTEDAEGEHTAAHPDAVEALTGMDAEQMRARILEAVAQLSGDILQVPSAVSAIKINGVRSVSYTHLDVYKRQR